ALAAIFLRDVTPSGWQPPVCSALDPCVQVLDPAIQVLLVGLPCQAVHAGRGVALDRVERRSQHGRADMVQERGEPLLLPDAVRLVVRVPAPVTRLPGPAPGACFADPRSPWSPSLAPPAPPRLAPLCSPALQRLRRSQTSRARAPP